MSLFRRKKLPAALAGGLVLVIAWLFWPGAEDPAGIWDRRSNGIWLGHAWVGHDSWFARYGRFAQKSRFRDPARLKELAGRLRAYHIRDLFLHLCPAEPGGAIPAVDDEALLRFLDEFEDFRVFAWIGGVNGAQVFPEDPEFRRAFASSAADLCARHPRLAGVQLNVEPCESGDPGFILLLTELRKTLPGEALISVAAYPPPTLWQPHAEVHWDEGYFRRVAEEADQMAVMMYDTGLHTRILYRRLLARWTREATDWARGTEVLLGVPAYDDAETCYHDPDTENLEQALAGISRGLAGMDRIPPNYAGVAIYCEWEMDEAKWQVLAEATQQKDAEPRKGS